MAETLEIPPTDLLLDEQNPRIPEPNEGQHETMRALAEYAPRKMVNLAADIVSVGGLDPSNLPIVMPLEGDSKRYIVLEGNRRIGAIKALENPETVADAMPVGLAKELRALSKKYHSDPLAHVSCVVVQNRDEANHWIALRHTGENEGVGVVKWGSDDQARFGARTKGEEIHTQALDFMEREGVLSSQQRRNIPVTSLKRLLQTPEVREKLGVELQDGQLQIMAAKKRVAKALRHVADDLTSRIKVKDIYTKDQRVAYAKALPKTIAVKATRKPGHGVPASLSTSAPVARPTKAAPRKKGPRKKLIPRDCVLNIDDERLRRIEQELRHLTIEDFPNAVGVLIRVFVELTTDAYIERHALAGVTADSKLYKKLETVRRDLVGRQKLTKAQAGAVARACAKDSFLAPSIDVMHSYIHNKHMFPVPGDLLAHWDNLQPYVVACWSA